MAREFQGQFNEALREAELDTVKKDVEAIGKIDPMAGVRKEMAKVDSAVRDATRPAAKPATTVAASEPVAPLVESEAPDPGPVPPAEPAAPVAEAKS
jgi:sec-independent protein translocase protein TatB